MSWGNRPNVKQSIQQDTKNLVYVSSDRFEAALHARGLYDIDQVARDMNSYPDTLRYRLKVGTFLPYMAEKLEKLYGIAPAEYAPITLVDVEESPVLTEEEIERIAIRVAEEVVKMLVDRYFVKEG